MLWGVWHARERLYSLPAARDKVAWGYRGPVLNGRPGGECGLNRARFCGSDATLWKNRQLAVIQC